MKSFKKLLLGILSVSLLGVAAYALDCASGVQVHTRYTSGGSEIFCLDQSGALDVTDVIVGDDADIDGEVIVGAGIKLGDAATPTAVPTTSNGSNYGLKIPVFNYTNTTIAAGSALTVSTQAAASAMPGYATPSTTLSTTTWLGIADASIAAGSYGWAVVSGWANALTTGTVAVGDLLVTSNSSTGYLGAITPSASVVEGTVVGVASSSGTSAGGLTLIRVGR